MKIQVSGYDKSLTEKYVASQNGECTITKIDSKQIEGIFHFDAYSNNGNGPDKVSVTEGQFRVEL